MATLSLPQLSLNLPSTRMSVNFDAFAGDINTTTTRNPKIENTQRLNRKPLPGTSTKSRRQGYLPALSLTEVTEEHEPHNQLVSRHDSGVGSDIDTERWSHDPLFYPIQSPYALPRTGSPAPSTTSPSSETDSIFSHALSTSTARTGSTTSFQSNLSMGSYFDEPLNISALPLSLLEHILSYALPVTQTISIGPISMEHRHMQYRYHRPSLGYMDVRQALKHPLFSVSHHIRNASMNVLYQKCTFSIDLASIYYTKVASTAEDNMKRHQKFWVENPPKIVEDSLQKMAKLHIRLPVPSTEPGVQRGREEDVMIDGKDGKGGGNLKISSIKKEQEDAQNVQKCLDAIVKLLILSPDEFLQRKRPFGRQRALSDSRSYVSNRSTDTSDDKRTPLKRLEVVLVKRNPWVTVQPEVLGLVKTLRKLQISGLTRWVFELDSQQFAWATKHGRKWKGVDPDGKTLLKDLQALSIPDKPIQLIFTPIQQKFTNVDKPGRIGLINSKRPKIPMIINTSAMPPRDGPPIPPTPKSAFRALFGKKSHKRSDSYEDTMAEDRETGFGGKASSKHRPPPSIEELQKIADDIRNGLY